MEQPITPSPTTEVPVWSQPPKQVPSNNLSLPEETQDLDVQPPETARQISFPSPTHFPSETLGRPKTPVIVTDKPHPENSDDTAQVSLPLHVIPCSWCISFLALDKALREHVAFSCTANSGARD